MVRVAAEMGAMSSGNWSLAISGTGSVVEPSTKKLLAMASGDCWIWQHATLGYDPGSNGAIESDIADLLMIDQTRPRFASYPNGALLILRGVGHQEASLDEELVSVRLWIEPDRVVSFVRRPVVAILEIVAQYDQNSGPASPADFVAELAQRLVENMADTMAIIEDDIAALEVDSASGPINDLQERMAARRMSIIPLRRYLAPQRDALIQLLATRQEWLNEDSRHRLRDVLDITTRYIEDLDEARDQLEVIQASLAAKFAERTNRAMLLLTIVAAVFLPLSLLTGLLGINVANIPFSDHPAAFWGVCGVLLALGSLQIWLVRRLGWP